MDNQTQQQISSPKQGSRWIFIGLGLCFILILGVILTSYKSKSTIQNIISSPKNESQLNTQDESPRWIKPVSSKKGYPVASGGLSASDSTRQFFIYSFSTKELHKVNQSLVSGGYASGIGTGGPKASPDLLYTAFIDQKTKNLWLLSNETLETKQVTQNGFVAYVSGWSPSSTKIIYQIPADSITARTRGMGGYQPTKEVFNPNLDSGFFVFDINSGKTKKLYPVEHFETFIDNDRILVRTTDQESNDRLIVFNINTFEADYGFVKEKFGYGADQFSFSKNGEKWAYTLSRNPTTDANIIYADFPDKEGEQIDSGDWAETQFPLISPDGTKLAFSRRDGYAEPGLPNYAVWVYNTSNKEKTKYNVEGWADTWVDENTLVVKASNASKKENYLYLLNLESGESTKIY